MTTAKEIMVAIQMDNIKDHRVAMDRIHTEMVATTTELKDSQSRSLISISTNLETIQK